MTIFTSLTFALKRLWSHRSLALALALGLAAAVALAVAVPLYSDGVNYTLLNTALSQSAAQTRRPPFTFIFHYVGSWHEPIDHAQFTPVDQFMQQQAAGVIGLPSEGVTRYAATDSLQLYPDGETINRRQRLDLVRLTTLSGVFEHIRLVEGTLPSPTEAGGEVIQALVSLKLANDIGLQFGETYLLYKPGETGQPPYQMRVTIAGVWLPADSTDPFWFYTPESFEKKLLVPEETFFGAAVEGLPKPINEAAWRIAFDGSAIHAEDVPGLLGRISQAQTQANALLPYTDLELSPVQPLRQYYRQALALTGLLFVFSAPIFTLLLYFLGLVAAMLVRRQRSEIAVLRSRGASRAYVVSVYWLEWTLLGTLTLPAGIWGGVGLAQLVGRTQSFLDFSRPADLPIRITPVVLGLGAGAVILSILLSVIPAWQASEHTIVSYKQERARARRKPLWQRAYLDMLLLIPALYGLYTLQQAKNGLLRILGFSAGSVNPFENPLLFLLPTLFILSLSLLLLRLLPFLLSALAWLSAHLPSLPSLLALRQLARSGGAHAGPLALMALTLSLAGFVASMAATLDHYLVDSAYYEAGADLNLAEGGEYTGDTGSSQPPGAPGSPQLPRPTPAEDAVWHFLPVSDHLSLPGVRAAARVGKYESELRAAGRSLDGRLLGVDRTDFPVVAFFRADFASEPLGGLMNRLALDPAALLVDSDTWARLNLSSGDSVQVQVTSGETRTLSFKAVGALDYFPSIYPEDGPFYIGNLDYIFEAFGGLLPYDVWLRIAPEADTQAIVLGLYNMGVNVVRVQDARAEVQTVFASPNRQGMLGLLSVGFLAAALLTVVGFLLYAVLSFRERFIQLGVLRAIGLSAWQMGAALAVEQMFLILTGLASGTGIAVLTAALYIPHLPVTLGSHPGTPPYVVEIAWENILRVYGIFAAMLLAGLLATSWLLARMKIFQAIKMGETV